MKNNFCSKCGSRLKRAEEEYPVKPGDIVEDYSNNILEVIAVSNNLDDVIDYDSTGAMSDYLREAKQEGESLEGDIYVAVVDESITKPEEEMPPGNTYVYTYGEGGVTKVEK